MRTILQHLLFLFHFLSFPLHAHPLFGMEKMAFALAQALHALRLDLALSFTRSGPLEERGAASLVSF